MNSKWYSDLLGVPLDEERTSQPVYSVPASRGAATLLDRMHHLKRKSDPELFFFETNDFEASLRYLRANDFAFAGEPQHFPDLSEATLLDPDGNRMRVRQMRNPASTKISS